MQVLVCVASRHGSTAEIAIALATGLEAAGIGATVLAPDAVTSLDGFDAVVVGSAVYMGRWMESARRFVDRHGPALRERPVWLFSSGPVGDPLRPVEVPAEIAAISAATSARDHLLLAGRLDRRDLGLGERAIATAIRAAEGDYRSWDAIRSWARVMASDLLAPSGTTAPI